VYAVRGGTSGLAGEGGPVFPTGYRPIGMDRTRFVFEGEKDKGFADSNSPEPILRKLSSAPGPFAIHRLVEKAGPASNRDEHRENAGANWMERRGSGHSSDHFGMRTASVFAGSRH